MNKGLFPLHCLVLSVLIIEMGQAAPKLINIKISKQLIIFLLFSAPSSFNDSIEKSGNYILNFQSYFLHTKTVMSPHEILQPVYFNITVFRNVFIFSKNVKVLSKANSHSPALLYIRPFRLLSNPSHLVTRHMP